VLSDRLFNLRTTMGLSQQQIADAIGIERPVYTRYENGTRKPIADNIVKLASFYGVSADYILCSTDDPSPAGQQPAQDGTMLDLSWGLYESSKDLSEDDKRELLEIIELKKRLKKK
jgi:Predicted transcriptional regulators